MPDYKGELFVALQRLLPQHTLSRLIAKLADARSPWLKDKLIHQFIQAYDVELSEALHEEFSHYENFNAFFTRHLKPDARPLDDAKDAITCPADGTVSQIGRIDGSQLIQAKGKSFTSDALLGNSDDAAHFTNGHFTTIYLSPKDYHRVHMPVGGTLQMTRYIPGKLFSVSNSTAQHIPELFARNERLVCLFDTEVGKVAVVLVGAMLVAGIGTVWQPEHQPNPGAITETLFPADECPLLDKGAELGHFNFGSTVILLFEEDALQWQENYEAGSVTRMGERLATTLK